MVGGRMGVLWTCTALLALASAGPLQRFLREADDYQGIDLSAYANFTANEVCFSDNEVFQKGDLMPNPGPCEECRCEPPSIVCNMIKCPVNNNGCRTIQRPNHCCPDYNCECDYNGQLYNDGERVDMPEDPCQVCYCKGGEVMCNSITCYHRDDCEPKHVPGQCCPKYENCPVKDMGATKTDDKSIGSRSPNKTSNNSPKRDMTPWLLTKSAPKTSSVPVSKQPATSEHTTENGNIVIVSDWLTERRTTTEDVSQQSESKYEGSNINHTEVPTIVTDPVYMTTTQQKNVNNLHFDDKILKKSETMTPLDEVIFTRIDMLRGNVESSTPASTSLETTIRTTVVPSNSFSSKEDSDMISTIETTTNEAVSTTDAFTESGDEISSQSGLDDAELGNKIRLPIENKEIGDMEIDELTNPTEIPTTDFPVISSNENILVTEENSKHSNSSTTSTHPNVENVAMIYLDKNRDTLSGNEITTIRPINSKEPLIRTTMELNTEVGRNSETNGENSNITQIDKVSEEITLENMFGLETANKKEAEYITTNQPATINVDINTFKVDHLLSEEVKPVSQSNTKIKETQGSLEPYKNREDFNDNSLESRDETLDEENIDGSKGDTSNSKKDGESFESSERTIISEVETTTPYFTEDHMSRSNLAPSKFAQEQSEEEIADKELTTESVNPTTTTTAVSEPNEVNSLNKISISSDTSIIAHNNSSVNEYIQRRDEKKENVADPNMLSIKGTKISNETLVTNENMESPVTEISYEESNTDLEIVSHGNQDLANKNGLHIIGVPQKVKEVQEELFVDPHEKGDNAEDSKDGPPVLELNSHVPFLQLGGSGSSDASETLQDDYQTTVPSQTKTLSVLRTNENFKNGVQSNPLTTVIPDRENLKKESNDNLFTTIPPSTYDKEKNISNVVTPDKYIGRIKTVEPELVTIPTTSHIPLTPGDLKMLAEYLIHEKIKTVESKNLSQYSVNPWLKGNLTSEEKIASIISAANITIGVMNHTDIRTRTVLPETLTKTNEINRVEKPEKDALFKGNSILDNGIVIVNKTDYLHNKYNENEGYSKVNLKPQNDIHDGIATGNDISTDPITLKETSTSTLYRSSEEETDQTTELPTLMHATVNTDLDSIGQDVEIQKNISDNKKTEKNILTTTLSEVETSTLMTEIENKDVETNNTSQNTPQDVLGIGKESRLNINFDEQITKTDGRTNTSTSKGDLLKNQKTSELQRKGQVSAALENNDLTIPKESSQKPVVIP